MRKPDATCVLFYENETQYQEYLSIFEDADKLPDTFEKWSVMAESQYQSCIKNGMNMMRIHASPREFSAWCTENKFPCNSRARMLFAASKGFELIK